MATGSSPSTSGREPTPWPPWPRVSSGRAIASSSFPTAVRLYLPGGGEDGVRSVLQRVADNCVATQERTGRSVVVEPGEQGADAFDRLKHRSEMRWL